MEGRKGLSAWLSAPPSAVMSPVYRKTPIASEEVLALTAYLETAAVGGQAAAADGTLSFLLTGVALAALVLVLFDLVWRRRYVATRAPLVAKSRTQGRTMEGHNS